MWPKYRLPTLVLFQTATCQVMIENLNVFTFAQNDIQHEQAQGHTVLDRIRCIGMLPARPKLLREVSSATPKIVYGDWSWLTRLKMGI